MDARRIAEEAGGGLDDEVLDLGRRRFDAMVARRLAGVEFQVFAIDCGVSDVFMGGINGCKRIRMKAEDDH